MELPSSKIKRVYRVRTFGEVNQEMLNNLKNGITIDNIHYGDFLATIESQNNLISLSTLSYVIETSLSSKDL